MNIMLKAVMVAAFSTTNLVTPMFMSSSYAHEPYFRTVSSPECANPRLLRKIVTKFRIQARHVHQNSRLKIVDIHNPQQTRDLPQDSHLDQPVARRYCTGQAQLSDGRKREIWYLIEGGAGFASYSNNVEFCISDMDDWSIYDGKCRVLQ